jgi:hypothetical protein
MKLRGACEFFSTSSLWCGDPVVLPTIMACICSGRSGWSLRPMRSSNEILSGYVTPHYMLWVGGFFCGCWAGMLFTVAVCRGELGEFPARAHMVYKASVSLTAQQCFHGLLSAMLLSALSCLCCCSGSGDVPACYAREGSHECCVSSCLACVVDLSLCPVCCFLPSQGQGVNCV